MYVCTVYMTLHTYVIMEFFQRTGAPMRRFSCLTHFGCLVLWSSNLMCPTTSAAPLIISEVVDATLPGGLPKFVELTNTGSSSIDLSAFSMGTFNNGSLNLGGGASTPLSGTISAGDSFVVSFENGDGPGSGAFLSTYGFEPDFFSFGATINGDDVIALFDGPASTDGSGLLTGTILDIYGVRGTDGSGEFWEYTNSFAFRNPDVVSGASTFAPAQWTFGGSDFLETGNDATELSLILANTTPGSHSFTTTTTSVPEPSGLLLAGAGLFSLLAGARRVRQFSSANTCQSG